MLRTYIYAERELSKPYIHKCRSFVRNFRKCPPSLPFLVGTHTHTPSPPSYKQQHATKPVPRSVVGPLHSARLRLLFHPLSFPTTTYYVSAQRGRGGGGGGGGPPSYSCTSVAGDDWIGEGGGRFLGGGLWRTHTF